MLFLDGLPLVSSFGIRSPQLLDEAHSEWDKDDKSNQGSRGEEGNLDPKAAFFDPINRAGEGRLLKLFDLYHFDAVLPVLD